MSPRMARHVQDALIDTGVMTGDYVTRKTKTFTCRHCAAQVLACIDDLGFDVRANPEPLTNLGEAIAVASGRRTFASYHDQLCARGPHAIRYRSAEVVDVFAEHVCHATPLPTKPPPPPKPVAGDEPPF